MEKLNTKTGCFSAIQAIGTASPPYCQNQTKVAEYMEQHLSLSASEKRRLRMIYAATGVETRYSVLEDFISTDACTQTRMNIYKQNALPLAIAAIEDCIKVLKTPFDKEKITHLITVSCTGMYAPGLDIDLIQHYQLSQSIHRTAVNFMGCYGVFNALKIADAICKSDITATVLIVSVEICSIHLQKQTTLDNLISSALFSDGAGAAIIQPKNAILDPNTNIKKNAITNKNSIENKKTIEQDQKTNSLKNINLQINHFYCDILSQGKKDMAWEIGNFGFEIGLSAYVASLIESGIALFSKGLLDKLSLAKQTENQLLYAIHPGSKKILEACEKSLNIPKIANQNSYQVLSKYGNMSSATILFVLKSLWENLAGLKTLKTLETSINQTPIFCCGFGPGLTLESMLLEVNCD